MEIAKEEDYNPSQQITAFFIKRTAEHINRVGNNLRIMQGYSGISNDQINERAMMHDQSKYQPPQKQPYIWLTWHHKCKNEKVQFKYPKKIQEKIKEAIQHHKKCNRHHPQYHTDSNQMSVLDIVQMVCDWTAMSQQYNQGSCLNFYKENIHKWNFSKEKQQFIYKTIKQMDQRLK